MDLASDRRIFSASVFLVHEDSILLIKHKILKFWLPPGGEREGDETPIETARRELKEEVGAEAAIFPQIHHVQGVPPGFLIYEEHPAGPKGLHLNFSFVALAKDRFINTECREFDMYSWFTFPEILSMDGTTRNVQQCVQMIARYQSQGHF